MTMVILKVWVVLLSDQAYTENRPALEWSKQIWLLQGGFQESPLPVECNHIESQLVVALARNAIAKSCHRLQQKPTVAYSHPINSKDRTLEVHWAHGSGNGQKKQTKPIEIRNMTNIKPRTTTHLFSKMHKKYTWLRNCFFSWRKHMLICLLPASIEFIQVLLGLRSFCPMGVP